MPPKVSGNDYGVYHFRRSFKLDTVPREFIVHVSGDNRYRLIVNGRFVSAGPQRSDLMHWRFETIDIASHLRSGDNTIAAVVWNWGPYRPLAQHSLRTGFYLQGATVLEAVANTGPEWRVLHNNAYEVWPVPRTFGGYYASAPGERLNGARYPWGWDQPGYDDSHWSQVEVAADQTVLRGTAPFGVATAWQLTPRNIPAMEETPVRFSAIRRTEGISLAGGTIFGRDVVEIPAHTRATLLLDQSYLTNAYAVLDVSGGKDSEIILTYAESLIDESGNKGNRDAIEDKTIVGIQDAFRPAGEGIQRFRTLWFRTYRYVQLEIQTKNEPLRIHDFFGIYTGYPYELNASFTSELPWLAELWEINWRTLRLCAFETFFDTPYYEQLQYIGDTRIQSLMSLYLSGDDRLVRQAIDHFNQSRIPEGITASRYPSHEAQYIPPFSLLWVAMVHDYWMHRDRPDYIRSLLPGIRGVLAWFEQRIDENGLLGSIPWWPFVDWVDSWKEGVPPGGHDGGSVVISLQFAYALQFAAELEESLGQPSQGAYYRTLASGLIDAARRYAWDGDRGLFRDAPGVDAYSQHTNAMAILVGAVPTDQRQALVSRILTDTDLAQASFYFAFYVHEAMRIAGAGDDYVKQLQPWREMLARGLTSTPENPDPTRSDSHAWSAHPNYGLLAIVLGMRPDEPGFRSVRIAPHLGFLGEVSGKMPHPLGDIEVDLTRQGDFGLRANVLLPPGLSGTFAWGGREYPLKPGYQEIQIDGT